jgi:hypothetical protein
MDVVGNIVLIEQLVELLVIDSVRAFDLPFNRGARGRM